MNRKIDSYLKSIVRLLKEKNNYNELYSEIICHENRNLNGCIKDILRIFTDLDVSNRKKFKLSGDNILMSNFNDDDYSKRKILLGICVKLENVSQDIDNFILFLDKRKVRYDIIFSVYDNVGYMEIKLVNEDDVVRVIDYIDSKLSRNLYSINPLLFSIDNVMLSIDCEYSYIDLLIKYLYNFSNKMEELKKDIDYLNFKDYMLEEYFKVNNQIDMYRYLEFNVINIKLSSFFINLDIITNLIIYLFNGNGMDEFRCYFRKLNRKNSRLLTKYLEYDSFDNSKMLFSELVKVMYLNYGKNKTIDSIKNYVNTGREEYITRKNNLRKRVMSIGNFMIYLKTINIDYELEMLFDEYAFEMKKKILEDVCISVYQNGVDLKDKNFGKIQVARVLVRMSYGDYSVITRYDDTRKKAIDNIDSNLVVKLIKGTLGIEHVKKEDELYELYAEYIENKCC